MGTGRTDEFRKDAVRIALTSGLSRRQIAGDPGGGLSNLNKWVCGRFATTCISSCAEQKAVSTQPFTLIEFWPIPKVRHRIGLLPPDHLLRAMDRLCRSVVRASAAGANLLPDGQTVG